MIIYRGTTKRLRFLLPFDTIGIERVYITLSQWKKVIIEKAISDCFLSENLITTVLTQEDTLLLSEKVDGEIQLRVVLKEDDTALASEPSAFKVGRILKEGVI